MICGGLGTVRDVHKRQGRSPDGHNVWSHNGPLRRRPRRVRAPRRAGWAAGGVAAHQVVQADEFWVISMPGRGPAAMECTGSVAAQALLVVAPGGQVGEVGMGQGVVCVPGGRVGGGVRVAAPRRATPVRRVCAGMSSTT